jgi:hypothetical protein
MTTYQDLHWDSLRFVKTHLYRRLATPLNNALGRLAIARHVNDPAEAREQYRRVEQNLEIALNLVKAWTALIHVKSGGTIRQTQYRQIAPGGFPAWLVDYLTTQTAFRIGHTLPVLVHPETFYESLLLLSLIGAEVGTRKELVTCDTPDEDSTIRIRVIFEPPSSGPYAGLGALYKRLDAQNQPDIMFDLQVLQEFMRINGAGLKLQNNRRSGEQALAASLPAASAFAPLLRGLGHVSEKKNTAGPAEKPTNGTPRTAGISGEVENRSETLIVRPPDFDERLRTSAGESDSESAARTSARADEVENRSETLIVPPPNLHERLAAPADAESRPEVQASETRTPGTGPFSQPPEPGVIEVVEPENASDTLIVPPPDYRRRLSLQRQPPRSGRYPPPNGDSSSSAEAGDQDTSAPAE